MLFRPIPYQENITYICKVFEIVNYKYTFEYLSLFLAFGGLVPMEIPKYIYPSKYTTGCEYKSNNTYMYIQRFILQHITLKIEKCRNNIYKKIEEPELIVFIIINLISKK